MSSPGGFHLPIFHTRLHAGQGPMHTAALPPQSSLELLVALQELGRKEPDSAPGPAPAGLSTGSWGAASVLSAKRRAPWRLPKSSSYQSRAVPPLSVPKGLLPSLPATVLLLERLNMKRKCSWVIARGNRACQLAV